MIRIGIECEQLEGNRFGIGHTLAQFLASLTHIRDIEKEFIFVLYFKERVPDDSYLAHPIFEKKVLMGGRGFFKVSFNIFYHILLPLRHWLDRIDLFFFPSYMLPAFFIGKAVVVLVNDVYWEARRNNIPLRYRISYRLFCWWAARRADIMTISEFSKKELQEAYRIPDKRIFVNPWGMETIFRVLPRTEDYHTNVSHIRERLDVRRDFFLSIGQAFPRRHIREAMEAFGIIAKNHPDMQYVVGCVDKYNPPALKTLAETVNKKLGREVIVMKEYLPRADLPYLMNEMTALLYVSEKEALGIPPIEAGLCGKPAIIADIPTNKEIFGDCGFFVKDPSKPQEIAEQMELVMKEPVIVRDILKTQSENITRYRWETHTKNLLQKFHDLL